MAGPKCDGCGEEIQAGRGFYDPQANIFLHYEVPGIDNAPAGTEIPMNASGSCMMGYVVKKGEVYNFHPKCVVPVENLEEFVEGL